jgi:two-component system chemotaxis response regulator CheB
VVIGASAGGVETLRRVAGGLPADLAAAVCVVLHIAPSSPSALPRILTRAGALPCQAAADGDELLPGRILVAPPDRHLIIEDGRVRVTVGPRENGHRPAIDALFRSASRARDGRVIGVILSGTRDDGSAGLALIKARGGATIVQDPEEAMYAGMPRSALSSVEPDAIVPSRRVAAVVVAMVNGEQLPPGSDRPEDPPDPPPPSEPPADPSQPLTTICPDCGGVLTERREAGVAQWECRVGHRYSAESLLNAQAHDVEAALWAAVRALEERRTLLDRMATQFEAREQYRSAASVRGRAQEAAGQARAVREALERAAVTSLGEIEESAPEDDADTAGGQQEGLAS